MKVIDVLSIPFKYPNNSKYFICTKEEFNVPEDKHHLFHDCNVTKLSAGGRGCNGYISIYCDGSYVEKLGEFRINE